MRAHTCLWHKKLQHERRRRRRDSFGRSACSRTAEIDWTPRTFLVLDFRLHILDGVARLDLQNNVNLQERNPTRIHGPFGQYPSGTEWMVNCLSSLTAVPAAKVMAGKKLTISAVNGDRILLISAGNYRLCTSSPQELSSKIRRNFALDASSFLFHITNSVVLNVKFQMLAKISAKRI